MPDNQFTNQLLSINPVQAHQFQDGVNPLSQATAQGLTPQTGSIFDPINRFIVANQQAEAERERFASDSAFRNARLAQEAEATNFERTKYRAGVQERETSRTSAVNRLKNIPMDWMQANAGHLLNEDGTVNDAVITPDIAANVGTQYRTDLADFTANATTVKREQARFDLEERRRLATEAEWRGKAQKLANSVSGEFKGNPLYNSKRVQSWIDSGSPSAIPQMINYNKGIRDWQRVNAGSIIIDDDGNYGKVTRNGIMDMTPEAGAAQANVLPAEKILNKATLVSQLAAVEEKALRDVATTATGAAAVTLPKAALMRDKVFNAAFNNQDIPAKLDQAGIAHTREAVETLKGKVQQAVKTSKDTSMDLSAIIDDVLMAETQELPGSDTRHIRQPLGSKTIYFPTGDGGSRAVDFTSNEGQNLIDEAKFEMARTDERDADQISDDDAFAFINEEVEKMKLQQSGTFNPLDRTFASRISQFGQEVGKKVSDIGSALSPDTEGLRRSTRNITESLSNLFGD